jgi:RNA polymerase primary sigma factor
MKVKVNKRERAPKRAAKNIAVRAAKTKSPAARAKTASVKNAARPAKAMKTSAVKLGSSRVKKSAPIKVTLAVTAPIVAPVPQPKPVLEAKELDPKIVQLPVMPPEEEEPSKEELEQMTVAAAPTPTVVEEPRGAYDGDTAYQLYLKEIGQTALLTIEQENMLAARIKKGDKAAREQMIKANLRLVVKIARDYEGYGVPLLDLISEGNIGLMKGVERFDPSKGAKLSTYSAWWIKQAIKRALANQGKTIRLPVHVVDKLFHIRRAEARLQEAFGRDPTDDEIAEELDSTPEKIRELRAASQRPASLEAPLGYDSDNRVADVVADDNADNPYDLVEEKANNAMLREVMKDLDPREVTILRYRFGLDGDNEKTLEEVGRKFGLTRERIRQIQEIALKKLRKKIDKLESSRKAA